jgi:hypothetical protein
MKTPENSGLILEERKKYSVSEKGLKIIGFFKKLDKT